MKQHTQVQLEARTERCGNTTTHYFKIGKGNCYLTRGVGQTEEETRANAKRLVHCWNSHDTLVTALRGMLSDWQDQFGEKACDCRPEPENAGHVCNACLARIALQNENPTNNL
jgi:hypothetical protein